MQKYGRIKGNQLELSSKQREGFKPVEYAEIPEFNQTTHYVEQSAPMENKEYIFVGIEIKELPKDLNEGEEFDENVF